MAPTPCLRCPDHLGRTGGGADTPLDLIAGCENPKPCQSELIVLEHGSYSGDPVTKVLLQPLTGGSSGPGQRGHGGLPRLDRQEQRCCSGTCACSSGPWWQHGGIVKNKAEKGLSGAESHTQLMEASGFQTWGDKCHLVHCHLTPLCPRGGIECP